MKRRTKEEEAAYKRKWRVRNVPPCPTGDVLPVKSVLPVPPDVLPDTSLMVIRKLTERVKELEAEILRLKTGHKKSEDPGDLFQRVMAAKEARLRA